MFFLYLVGTAFLAWMLAIPVFVIVRSAYSFLHRNNDITNKSEDGLLVTSFLISIPLAFLILFNIIQSEVEEPTSSSGLISHSQSQTKDYEPPKLIDYEPPEFIYHEPPDFSTFEFSDIPSYTISTPAETKPKTDDIVFLSYPEYANRNEKVHVKIKGEPYTEYNVTVSYSSGVSTAEGLYSKTSDSEGYVTWSWKVGGRTSFGRYPITVSGGGSTETVYFRVVA